MNPEVIQRTGARFYDRSKADRGWAGSVAKRAPTLGGLTVLEITGAEPALASFLVSLDRAGLRVCMDSDGDSYQFRWASGYQNGNAIRVQGVLE
jgi:hypothetical protein